MSLLYLKLLSEKMPDLPIICIMGPTASGKTALALALSEQFPIEIINVDSAQIYQGMDIGSGKPSVAVRKKVPHHLMDILDPAQPYSAAQFCYNAIEAIQSIISRNRIPILVGGTMLYFKALQQGLSELPESSPIIRQQLENHLQENGLDALYQRLQVLDPLRASQIKSTDPQRILRALEIYDITGKTMSEWLVRPRIPLHSYQFINIALIPQTTPREVLHQRIEQRFVGMLDEGLVEEVKKLYQRGDLAPSMPAIRAVGYRQVWQYLANELSYEAMRETAIAATRQLAKRQLTWLRSWPQMQFFDMDAPDLLVNVSSNINQQQHN